MTKSSHLFSKNIFILIIIGIAILLTAISSKLPDGLEWTAEKLGFINKEENLMQSPFSDYFISNSFSPGINQIFSAILGACLLIGLIFLIMFWLKRKTPPI